MIFPPIPKSQLHFMYIFERKFWGSYLYKNNFTQVTGCAGECGRSRNFLLNFYLNFMAVMQGTYLNVPSF